jgi:DUSAM domain-containing protein
MTTGDERGEFYPRGDWGRARDLERRLEQGERLSLDDETRELLRTVGTDVGLSPEHISERLKSQEGAEELLREERARIQQGSRALIAAMKAAWDLARAGSPEDGYAVLDKLIQTEPVPWHQECARREADHIRHWVKATRDQS